MITLHQRSTTNKAGHTMTYQYDTIKGMPIREYMRIKARQRYQPHPNPATQASKLSEEEARIAHDLHSKGISQTQIARILNTTKHRVRSLFAAKRAAVTTDVGDLVQMW